MKLVCFNEKFKCFIRISNRNSSSRRHSRRVCFCYVSYLRLETRNQSKYGKFSQILHTFDLQPLATCYCYCQLSIATASSLLLHLQTSDAANFDFCYCLFLKFQQQTQQQTQKQQKASDSVYAKFLTKYATKKGKRSLVASTCHLDLCIQLCGSAY